MSTLKGMKSDIYNKLTTLAISRLTNIKTTVEEIKGLESPLSSTHIKTLCSYRTEVEKKCSDFELNFQRLIIGDESELIPEATLSSHQDKVNDLRANILAMIEVMTPEPILLSPSGRSDLSTSASVNTQSTSVRLPKLDLNKFSGDLNTWLNFINLYDSTIHKSPSLNAVVKFQYLLSVLSEEPLNLVKGLNLTSANYHIAYELLRQRYHNPRRLTTLHLNQILDLPNVTATSTKHLRNFVNVFTEHSQALKALDCDLTEDNNPLLSALLLRKLDNQLCKRLEQYRTTNDAPVHSLPDAKDIMKFLTIECNQVEDVSLHTVPHANKNTASECCQRSKPHSSKRVSFASRDVTLVATQNPVNDFHAQNKTPHCFDCKQSSHKIYNCDSFRRKTPSERFKLVKRESRCVSCLGTHSIKECRSKLTCKSCHMKHHSLLHFTRSEPPNPSEDIEPQKPRPTQVASQMSQHLDSPSVAMTSHSSYANNSSTVLLGTLLVKLKTPEGNSHVFRALLDSGSMCHLISERAAKLLNTRRLPSDVTLSGLSQSVTQNKGALVANLETLSGFVLSANQQWIILDNLTANLPVAPLSPDVFKRTQRYVLADPTFHLPSPVDIILSGATLPLILTNQQYSLGPDLPYVLGTRFGYVVMGTAPCIKSSHYSSPASVGLNISLVSLNDVDLHASLQRFWHQEEPPVFNQKTEEENACDTHFNSTHARDNTGRYIVKLPFKEDPLSLGSSQLSAESRFLSLERKFAAQPAFAQLYHNFMTEYLDLGHMTKVQDMDVALPHYFLPHHGVLKAQSSTTKLRVVFDASAKTTSGVSLNDLLLTGPKLQNNICDLLIQFRTHTYVFSCDIRQMYRQILVHPDDRNFQLILWRDKPDQPIATHQLNTVTYGINSSPYLAIKTLHQLANDEGEHFPAAAQVLRTQAYVDDIISGADTEESALELQQQLTKLLRKGGFELRKWVSNLPQLLQTLPESHIETPVFLQESSQPHFSILGLHWSPTTDCFTYTLQWPIDTHPTKRSVLSLIAKIYDPCGFLAPCIMRAKCFMQLLWTKGVTWDEPLPPELAAQWHSFVTDAHHIERVSIPRAFQFSLSCSIQIHGFADSSEAGFAAIVYFRCQLNSGQVVISPVIAKTRVAPLKRVTLPRLELCAAHLLAKLVAHCQNTFATKINTTNVFLWSDSSVALTWLRTPSYKLKTYVANRVAQTQELVHPESWHHISSADNPADCASRGIPASQLVNHPLWWTGPSWLQLPHSSWPTPRFTPVDLNTDNETKETPLTVLTVAVQHEWELLSTFSSWDKLQRVMALVLRFVHNCRSKDHRWGLISLSELTAARHKIFRLVQQSAFSEDISLLSKQRECSKRLQRLKPFLGPDGLLRVGGRLSLTSLSQDVRHPVLLPKSHPVVNLLVDHYHLSHLHAGPQLTQAMLTRSVWILCARSVIRSRIFKCLVCFKNKPTNKIPLMGELPLSRVTPARPFLSTGVDYAGPFTIKILNLRSSRQVKAYICIFICMVTKAVHIEVVTDLTTEAFIAALTRLVSRRGLCKDVYSDCGTNFIGADAALRRILQDSIHSAEAQERLQRSSTSHGMRFHFNPPAAPHQGGLWESAVKSAKHHLRRVMGNTVLTLPEFTTLTTQIEAMLNSRPLTPLSSDPADISALTPGHFLIGAPLAAVPEQDLLDVPQNRLKHWRQVQAFNQRIWERWHMEYIHTLHQRAKWTRIHDNLKVGDLVLMHTPSAPLSWPLAKVTSVHPGVDGVVRVVKLKTAHGTFTRPAAKVYPLPIDYA